MMKRIVLFFSVYVSLLTVCAQEKQSGEGSIATLEGVKVPEIVVEKWLDKSFSSRRTFTLIDFLDEAHVSDAEEIAKLNEFQKKFLWSMNVVGLSAAPEEAITALKESGTKTRFVWAVDTRETMKKQLGIKDVPHAILIDELGIIRWQGKLREMSLESMEDTTFKYKLYGKPYLNQQAPELTVEKWLTPKPEMEGKFILIDFWATTCATCVLGIPDMNEYSKRFKEDLIVIGMTNEREERVRSMKKPVIEYYIASDTKMTLMKELKITGIPYSILVDPKGIVRWEGFPAKKGYELTAEVIEQIIEKYKQ